jgi:hypothetical protein
MTKADIARLLTLIAAFDRRTIGETDVEAWHLILADLEPNDCMEAVRAHYMTESRWLMPADVRAFAVNAARHREGHRRITEREAAIDAENPRHQELTARERPLLALMAGTSVKSAPRPSWRDRHRRVPVPLTPKPPFTAEELAAAKALLDEAAAETVRS